VTANRLWLSLAAAPGAQRQSARIGEVEPQALDRLDPAGLPWVVVTLAPELPGDLYITNQIHREFQDHITGQPATITPADLSRQRDRPPPVLFAAAPRSSRFSSQTVSPNPSE
jgi:hypothetical protein